MHDLSKNHHNLRFEVSIIPLSVHFSSLESLTGNPVCSPTRSALLSGRTPFRDCIYGANEQQPFPAVTPTVAQQARSVGYNTLFVGKWHLVSTKLSEFVQWTSRDSPSREF